ncbi:hypothetical protein ACFRCG_34005 [Embleya sp. NPDC056575]|uniref:hypothetical protein n=1 Tax=unclassified Embleya TaxID=2699296 RepID=UPI00369771AA
MADGELVERIVATTGLAPGEVARIVDDVLAWYREPVEDYVRRRHRHHRVYGRRNAQIYRLIADELDERLVAPPRLTERQLRRVIYG